ncbi:MAG: dynamin family protein [Symploca sp. SIO2D2]|nr:dynamin family protein [Symploca sp. SIO2D2]
MVSDILKPNVHELQKDVIELLGQISTLMNYASTALGSDSSGAKYREFQQEVLEVARNVEDLELRMAIVAPMKAGKSTIINAIVGQDLLPSRNAAMTTLPTEIFFNAEVTEPTLTLSAEILSVFQETFLFFKSQIKELGAEQMQEKISQYPHLIELLQQIQDTVGFPTHARTSGRKEIVKALTGLNDIIRLCSTISIPSKDPLVQLTEVPYIETNFWRFQGTQQSERLGNLVIVDTPGPNEAGENLRLTAVVAEQLRKSSIVLIVLDFTQLNNKAAEEVKKQVQPVIELLGKENLYVLVNKADQRRKGDMTPEQVKEFVFADLGLSESSDTDRVFEVSAIRAFSAATFMLELQQRPGIAIADMETAEALAQEALGARWEAKLRKASIEDLQEEADYLWEESGFKPLLDKAINALMESAAPRTMRSALNLCRNRLLELQDDLGLRSKAFYEQAEKLQNEVDALDADLSHLELCRNRLREVDKIRGGLQHNLNEILELLKNEAKVSIQDYFVEEDYNQADFLKKTDIKMREVFLTNIADFEIFPKWLSRRLKSKLEYKTSGVVELQSEGEAEDFSTQAISWAQQRAESLLSSVRQETGKEIEKARIGLTNFLKKETKPIIARARNRLKEAFDVDLVLPPPSLESDDMALAKPHVRSQTRYVNQGYGTRKIKKRAWYHWLWVVPFEETERFKIPDKKENYYTVSLEELVTKINKSIEASVNSINQGITKYLDEDFQQRIDIFFEGLDTYLRNYRDSLKQAQADQQLSLEEKKKLVEQLSSLVPKATEHIKKADAYIERTNQFMRGE